MLFFSLDCEFQAGKDYNTSVALAIEHNAWHIMTTLKKRKNNKYMNCIRQSSETSKNLTKVYSPFQMVLIKQLKNTNFCLYTHLVLISILQIFSLDCNLKPPELLISILLVGTTWKRKTLNALDQFPNMLLSFKHLLHAVFFVGIPSCGTFSGN